MIDSPARILVAEDDAGQVDVLRALLGQDAHQVITATDGKEALETARREFPDLILLDVLLPGMNGFEVCQRLRQDPSTCLIPVILLTCLGDTRDKVTGFKLGADEYVAKPYDAMELLARVERTLQRSREDLAANPLTGLPGGVALEREIRRRIAAGETFAVGRVDIRGLNVFNRAYGYDKGDHVVRLVGMILKSAVQELADKKDLAVHWGSDDFGFLTSVARAAVVAARVLENAEALLAMQLSAADRARGVLRREGPPPLEGPLLGLSIGITDVGPGGPAHPAPILDESEKTLREAKRGNAGPLVRRFATPV